MAAASDSASLRGLANFPSSPHDAFHSHSRPGGIGDPTVEVVKAWRKQQLSPYF